MKAISWRENTPYVYVTYLLWSSACIHAALSATVTRWANCFLSFWPAAGNQLKVLEHASSFAYAALSVTATSWANSVFPFFLTRNQNSVRLRIPAILRHPKLSVFIKAALFYAALSVKHTKLGPELSRPTDTQSLSESSSCKTACILAAPECSTHTQPANPNCCMLWFNLGPKAGFFKAYCLKNWRYSIRI